MLPMHLFRFSNPTCTDRCWGSTVNHYGKIMFLQVAFRAMDAGCH